MHQALQEPLGTAGKPQPQALSCGTDGGEGGHGWVRKEQDVVGATGNVGAGSCNSNMVGRPESRSQLFYAHLGSPHLLDSWAAAGPTLPGSQVLKVALLRATYPQRLKDWPIQV